MKKLLDRIPHPMALLFYIAIFAAILTYIIPSGSYDRETIDGQEQTIPGTFEFTEETHANVMDLFISIAEGFQEASDIIFIVFAAAMMFGVMEKSGMVENVVGSFVKKIGVERRQTIVVMMTFVYGLFGNFIGLENNIVLIPIALLLSIAIGGDLMLGAGIGIGGVLIGFGLSPFNPYTIGVAQRIAELPLFSGWGLRTILVVIALSLLAIYNVRYLNKILKNEEESLTKDIDTTDMQLTKPLSEYFIRKKDLIMLVVFVLGIIFMLFGVFLKGWYINEISAVFLMVGVVNGIISRMNANEISNTFAKALEPTVLAAILIGIAQSIQFVLTKGNVNDTIAYSFASILDYFPSLFSGLFMSMAQSVINLFIASGSGQALVTMPIMLPVAEQVGMSRQLAILAFQIGDGITNTFTPTMGGLLAMLGLCKVPFGKWLRYIFPLTIIIFIAGWITLIIAALIGY